MCCNLPGSPFPESISSLKNLKELNLRSNQLTLVPESIANLTSLKNLVLNGNKLSVLPESVERLGKKGVLGDFREVMSSQKELTEE